MIRGFFPELSAAKQREEVNKPFVHGNDQGPQEAWRCAYGNQETSMLYYAHNFYDLRIWRFCLWDHIHILEWGTFDKACDDRHYKAYHEYSLKNKMSHEDSSQSWEKRSKIWNQGRRGWWKDGDETKIV